MYDQASLLWLANRLYDGEADERVIECLINNSDKGNQSPTFILDNLEFEAEAYCGECGCEVVGLLSEGYYLDPMAWVESECCGADVYIDPNLIVKATPQESFLYDLD